ncbi:MULTISPECIES: GNAT family N-acetyltransferase [unclassified Rhodococcus (in: high G+C Gram-positive bacteria)]|jgi:GNAT superfamily N-acetyltransferase|uniref:GNAT family N-acetyltransferase n=1 Tax=unclassified Rhodococcus (in: high G+C Gram-positive bacteria) TaxID=192944 RepID=UPI00055AF157|nr:MULTISPECIES: GNAT family N-acetyltransferase [unclassified Rhodococcus (in: high G+C Gram-positive bacteria)]KQU30645.1 acetyltransferase [Rhodococcus sp. Leaf225]KQU44451.1 acetyltransferase [Rhodococcus sp. Leaf258]MBY6680002.1 GNAT family N-acetyltransferase [Rhodococcus sp. BP-316]MBY6685904.1 GNAT family N-acetyltransferase [Rhodococcus sp. BP-288]MBY6694548.1 GNAT family N-acetyltransferase [Rhodococcus sp. BP-188]
MDELLTVTTTRLDDPDVVAMIDEVQQEYVRRYGGPDETPLDVREFLPPHGVMLRADLDGAVVGMGGWRTHEHGGPEAEGLRTGDAEIKRMYVRTEARGAGVARALLRTIEDTARDAGRLRLVLETGLRQPEAIGLYTSSGYRPLVPKFGLYRHEEQSVCMVKDLTG